MSSAEITSADERRLLAGLAEVSRDIRSHLILIDELAARRVEESNTNSPPPSQMALTP